MNWVGGSRMRCIKSSEIKKQKEFFERKRLQKKMQNNLGTPAITTEGNTSNMDLLSMFIVNQIAMKKKLTGKGKPKVAILSDSKRSHKPLCDEPIELPMSPCSPSRLSLVQSQPLYSVHTLGQKRRKHSILGETKMLSPVPESNLSDNSASDYIHHFQEVGSYSSYSSSSPSSSEILNLQPKPTAHISPPHPWKLSCTKTPQPIGLCEYDPLPALPHQSPVAGIQFQNSLCSPPLSYNSTETNKSIYTTEYQHNSSERNDQLFSGFCSEACRDHVSDGCIEIPLQNDKLFPVEAHDFSESHSRDHSSAFIPQCSKYAGTGSASSSGLENTCGSPRNAYGSSYYEGNRQCIQANAFHTEKCHWEDTLVTSQHCPAETSSRTRDPRVMSFGRKMTQDHSAVEKQGKAQEGLKMLRGICCGQECEENQFVPSHLQHDGIYEKASPRTRDMTTQTISVSNRQDAAVQCCLLKADRPSISNELTALVNNSSSLKKRKISSTRRQTSYSQETLQTDTQFAPSEIHKVKWNTPWKMSATREATQKASEAITGHKSTHKAKSQACMKKLPLPTLPCSHASAPDLDKQPSENMVVKGERCEGHKEESVNQNIAGNAGSTEERGFGFAAERGVNWVSEDSETLQEIADILLTLKQKNMHS